jgi:hypothetical protein
VEVLPEILLLSPNMLFLGGFASMVLGKCLPESVRFALGGCCRRLFGISGLALIACAVLLGAGGSRLLRASGYLPSGD